MPTQHEGGGGKPAPTATQSKRTRDEIRAETLKTRQPKKKLVEFLGEMIEIRQPTVDDLTKLRQDPEDQESRSPVIDILIKYAYVPDTNERLYEEEDRDVLLQQPFGQDFSRVVEAITELTDVNFRKPK